MTKPAPMTQEARRARTREAIRDAAMTLFADQGYDAVTVADIAKEAGVARSTFFRYFPDKPDVLFDDDESPYQLMTKAVAGAARASGQPLGDSFPAVMRIARAAALVLADSKAVQAIRHPVPEQLIADSPEVQLCILTRERGCTDALETALVEQGAAPLTARQAARVASACYATGYTEAFHAPELLPAAVEKAFDNLFTLGARGE
jgi:AcrR family transcriptional regulator